MKNTIMSQISNDEFAAIVQSSSSLKEVATKCGYSCNSGASTNLVKARINELNLPIPSRFVPRVVRQDEEIFIENSPVTQAVLRRRYFQNKYTEYKCSICGQEPFWNGQELVLTLDHINGNNKDDRIENLRWVCPNCDRQLDTFAGKNKHYVPMKKYCVDCGKEILLSSTRCIECSAIVKGQQQRKTDRPSREELKEDIRSLPFVTVGKKYNVTDNAIRKWCKSYGLPSRKIEISSYSDIEWAQL